MIKEHLSHSSQELSTVSSTPLLDAQILLAHVLNKNKTYLQAYPDQELPQAKLAEFLRLVDKRKQNIPIAYLTGEKEFFSFNFKVNESVLVPRPETEMLVEEAIAFIKDESADRNNIPRQISIIDLGTGSGCIAIALARTIKHQLPELKTAITAVDISTAALETARQNAALNNIPEEINFVISRWFDAIDPGMKFDLIISNPPYVNRNLPIACPDILHEPSIALFSEEEGLKDIKELILSLESRLTPGGLFLCEFGQEQGEFLMNYCNKSLRSGYNFEILKDLSGLDRVLKISKLLKA